MDAIIRNIQEEINSERYKKVSEIVSLYENRENIEIEEHLINIIEGFDYSNASDNDIKHKINMYNDFFSSLKTNVIESNIVLKNIVSLNSLIASQLKNLLIELNIKVTSFKEQNEFYHNYSIDFNLPENYIFKVQRPIEIIKNIEINGEEKYIQILPRKERKIYDEYNEFANKLGNIENFILFVKINYVTLPLKLKCTGIDLGSNNNLLISFYHDFDKVNNDEEVSDTLGYDNKKYYQYKESGFIKLGIQLKVGDAKRNKTVDGTIIKDIVLASENDQVLNIR
ncbi:MAG: hypothetical protein IJH20_05270 [Bacilli bacterium]|nr:hypothetical protein [Bacilli bacterium]